MAWSRPDSATLKGEVWAGLTLGLMVIPQGVAYAALAGMPLVAVLWGASTRLPVGPTALTCLLISASLTGLAAPGSGQWVLLAV